MKSQIPSESVSEQLATFPVILFHKSKKPPAEIKLKDKNRKSKMSAEIKSIKYNGSLTDTNKNKMVYKWKYDENGELVYLSQHIKSKNDYNITAIYDGAKTKISGKDSSGIVSQTIDGLKIIKITTNQGDFDWSY